MRKCHSEYVDQLDALILAAFYCPYCDINSISIIFNNNLLGIKYISILGIVCKHQTSFIVFH